MGKTVPEGWYDKSTKSHKQRNLHEWAFHMNFMKCAFVEFHNFYMKVSRVLDSVYDSLNRII